MPYGEVEIIFDYLDGTREIHRGKNALLDKGRESLAKVLANDVGDTFDLYISRMLFGNGGTSGGVPRHVLSTRTGLFGTTVANKVVSANIDSAVPSQVTFSAVLKFDDANGETINELALQLNSGDLYSMYTWTGFGKDSTVQTTMNWRVTFI